jgi:putative transposase
VERIEVSGVLRTFRFQLRPTVGQSQMLAATLEDHRELYNAALQERRDAYRACGRTVRYGGQSAQLKDIRAIRADQARWSFSSQQTTLRRLDKAFTAFFRRVKSGQAPGYPRFRGKYRFDSVTWPENADGCRWDSVPKSGQTRVRLLGIGHVKVNQHRATVGTVKTITVKREGRRWYLVLACDAGRPEPLPKTGKQVGIDMGAASFLTTSDGIHVPNPRHAAVSAAKLAIARQAAVRCEKGSNRRSKARARLASLHGKVRRQRLDHAHKTALKLVCEFDTIAHENLTIANMVRAARPKPDPAAPGAFLPNRRAAKAGLNRSIHDAGWGLFLAILTAKAESAGRTAIAVDPRNTSRACPRCGHVTAENRATQERFRCVVCRYTAHADVVGASNVLRAGLARRDAAVAV